jgi:quercetin dioxygenase-like cupin family protein
VRVDAHGNQPPIAGSALAVETHLGTGQPVELASEGADTILLSASRHELSGHAALVLAGDKESRDLEEGMFGLRATIGADVDHHAALGERERVVQVGRNKESATGKRSFEILFGPHNGSLRATMFVGHVPPGAAPWHFHLYDEIVWIWRGEGRFHTREGTEPLGPGSAFRIRPREVHIVENTSPSDELVVVGLFTPAGSPSAAYLAEAPA